MDSFFVSRLVWDRDLCSHEKNSLHQNLRNGPGDRFLHRLPSQSGGNRDVECIFRCREGENLWGIGETSKEPRNVVMTTFLIMSQKTAEAIH